MENSFAKVMAGKSDEDLLNVVANRNIYEVDTYVAAIEELEKRKLASDELILEKQKIIAGQTQKQQATLEQAENTKTDRKKAFLETLNLFKPTKEYYYTPIIIYLNVLVYLIMVLSGVDPMQPSVADLIAWGGDLRSLTMDGQQWRLLTSIFLHGGLFHLLLNMYAFIQVGALLETKFGNHRYFFLYIVTGLFASIASIAYNENIVSVGASGAIFGLYGLLLSLLILKALDIPKETRNNLLGSIVVFIVYNLMYGLKDKGIDNAAHIGGLVSGFVIGFIYYPAIKHPARSRYISIGISGILLITILAMPQFVTNKFGEFMAAMEKFAVIEEKALLIQQEDLSSVTADQAEHYVERFQKEGIDLWSENLNLLNSLTDLPPYLQERIDLLKKYCNLRIESCKVFQDLLRHDSQESVAKIDSLNKEIEGIIDQLEKLNE